MSKRNGREVVEEREVDETRQRAGHQGGHPAGDPAEPTLRAVLTELRQLRAETAAMHADLGSRLDGVCAEIRAIMEEFAAKLHSDIVARLDGVGNYAEKARAALHIVEDDEH